ncbi:MAG: alcohol dehydrogenase catalytic domain-containing protein [Defluviitaleaceae bacterium]|nr:alcohol dehydrogenase catalytic domain-containing protein [Defluviitaleaceae bacterium]
MKSIQYLGANQLGIVDTSIPEIPQGWARIKVSHAGICGGDLNIYAGTHPRAKVSLIMGHEFSGILDSDAGKFKKGDPVAVFPLISCGNCTPCQTGNPHVCNTLGLYGIDNSGGMAEYAIVPQDALVPLPKELSLRLGALIEPIAVAVHSVRDANFLPGDNAIVLGAGPIGLCTALVLRTFGARDVVVVENDLKRLALAEEMGFETFNPDKSDLLAFVKSKTDDNGYDYIYDCAGAPAFTLILFDLVKARGQIVIVAAYKKPAEFPFFKGMLKEARIVFVRVYRRKDFDIASQLAAEEPLFDKIITHELPVEKAQEGFDLILTKGTGAVKVMYKFD